MFRVDADVFPEYYIVFLIGEPIEAVNVVSAKGWIVNTRRFNDDEFRTLVSNSWFERWNDRWTPMGIRLINESDTGSAWIDGTGKITWAKFPSLVTAMVLEQEVEHILRWSRQHASKS